MPYKLRWPTLICHVNFFSIIISSHRAKSDVNYPNLGMPAKHIKKSENWLNGFRIHYEQKRTAIFTYKRAISKRNVQKVPIRIEIDSFFWSPQK